MNKEIGYLEAQQKALTVKWKLSYCSQGEECWCRVIEPEEKIIYNEIEEVYIAGSGCVPKIYAEKIVELHNATLNDIEKARIEGVLLGLKICKEMWTQGTISHENIRENELYYKEELKAISEPQPKK